MTRRKPARRFPPEVLNDAEVRALLAACGDRTLPERRNRALLVLLYRSGLRISEALMLHPKDIDLDSGTVRVLFAKGGRSRTVGIDPLAASELRRWVEARAERRFGDRAPLFCSRLGKPVTTGYLRRLLPGLARRAGILKRVHAHGLRHTHASELRTEGVDITILTGKPNELVAPVHDRMPVIVRPELYDLWLDPAAPPAALSPVLEPFPAAEMEAYPVGTRVNSPRNDDAELIERVG
jgi:integrase